MQNVGATCQVHLAQTVTSGGTKPELMYNWSHEYEI